MSSAEPVLEGWFTLNESKPHLLGSKCDDCGTYYFPKIRGEAQFCRNPDCQSESFAEVELSRSGKLWSYTNAVYKPPAPFVAADPFEPYAIAAVQLEHEQMIVLGAVVEGTSCDDLEVGMDMELALESLVDGKLTWKWKPTADVSGAEQ